MVALAVIASSAAVCIVAANIPFDDTPSYTITYVMNDGTNSSDNPQTYRQGTETVLNDPTREGYVFVGWYMDEDLTKEISRIPTDSEGDITLYAGWERSEVGSKITFDLTGSVVSKIATFNPVTERIMEGKIEFSYLNYVHGKGYLMERNESVTVTTSYGSGTNTNTDYYWSGESDTVWTKGGSKIIDTIDGQKQCTAWVSKEGASIETQYVSEDGITYLIEYENIQKMMMTTTTTSITYTLSEIGTADLEESFDVNVYCDKDIEVSGSGTNPAYDIITLTANGETFSGWYSASGKLLSSERTYVIDKFVSDVTLIARNDNNADLIFEDSAAVVSPAVDLTDVTWRFTDGTDKVIESDVLSYTFETKGYHTLFYEGTKSDGSRYFGLIDILIDSTVSKVYDWTYGGKHYQMTVDIKISDYLAYRNDTTAVRKQMDNARDSIYFTTDDKYIGYVASELTKMSKGMTSLERANLILSFVQSTEYVTDTVSRGQEEFWKYPVETLYDMNGDCEDTSFLFATIAKVMGYDVCTVLLPGHMAAGIVIDDSEFDGDAYHYTYKNKHYYYCETTSDEWKIGHEPLSQCKQDQVKRFLVP